MEYLCAHLREHEVFTLKKRENKELGFFLILLQTLVCRIRYSYQIRNKARYLLQIFDI